MMDLTLPTPQECERLTHVGAVFCKNLDLARWRGLWPQLRLMHGCMNWWLGDWLNYGRAEYGEKYAHAIDLGGFDYGTLRDYAWVAGAVALSRRRDTLSWSHHREVASLGPREQTKFLSLATQKGWTRGELRRAIRADQAEIQEPAIDPGFVPSVWVEKGLRNFRRLNVAGWTAEKKAALREELRPLVTLYETL